MRDLYEHAFRAALFPLYEGPLKRRYTHVHLQEYERSQWLDGRALEALQLAKLNALLRHCWTCVPFLARHWRDAGLGPEPLARVGDLARYPTIDKRVITDNFHEMRARPAGGRVLTKATGGSTGEPFCFEYSEQSYARRTAVMWRGYRWAGADVGRRTAYVWGSGRADGTTSVKERFYHRLFNRLMLDGFALTEGGAARYLDAIDAFGAAVVVGYVSPLVVMAEHMLARGRRLPRVRAVLTGAETLRDDQRQLLHEAFGVPVFNTYGCREVMLIASECDRQQGLHVSADHLVVETLDDGGEPVEGRPGQVALTDLHNYAMPLVRYRNGDVATSAPGPCPCGRGLPRLARVEGRELDMIRTPDGRIVSGEFFPHLMKDFAGVREFQVEQLALDELEIRLVCAPELGAEDRRRLADHVRQRIGGEVRVRLLEVDAIPRTASGKRRVTISHLREGVTAPR
jgi:phenylacetate-CoA ligase